MQISYNTQYNNAVNNEERCVACKKVKSIQIMLSNAFGCPWAMMIISFNTHITICAMPGSG